MVVGNLFVVNVYAEPLNQGCSWLKIAFVHSTLHFSLAHSQTLFGVLRVCCFFDLRQRDFA